LRRHTVQQQRTNRRGAKSPNPGTRVQVRLRQVHLSAVQSEYATAVISPPHPLRVVGTFEQNPPGFRSHIYSCHPQGNFKNPVVSTSCWHVYCEVCWLQILVSRNISGTTDGNVTDNRRVYNPLFAGRQKAVPSVLRGDVAVKLAPRLPVNGTTNARARTPQLSAARTTHSYGQNTGPQGLASKYVTEFVVPFVA